jgi:hypothetical protein
MKADWTDDRIDALSDRVDAGFVRVEREFARVDKRFEQVDSDIRELRSEMNARFDSLQRTMIQFGGLMIAALIGLIATQL